MKTLVIYDISDDDIRLKVSEVCKNFGLSRIQKSAFIGYLTSLRRKELSTILKKILGENDGNIQIFVICNADLALREIIGKEFKEEEGGTLIV
jgi:CRISPR-associated protein Cas2